MALSNRLHDLAKYRGYTVQILPHQLGADRDGVLHGCAAHRAKRRMSCISSGVSNGLPLWLVAAAPWSWSGFVGATLNQAQPFTYSCITAGAGVRVAVISWLMVIDLLATAAIRPTAANRSAERARFSLALAADVSISSCRTAPAIRSSSGSCNCGSSNCNWAGSVRPIGTQSAVRAPGAARRPE